MDSKSINYINELAGAGHQFIFVTDFLSQKTDVIPRENWKNSNVYFTSPLIEYQPMEDKTEAIDIEILESNKEAYQKNLEQVIRLIREGNSYLLNFTDSTLVKIDHSLLDIYLSSRAQYRLYYKDHFISFSPECFVKIEDKMIRTFPMKGTIDADEAQAEIKILEDLKEKYEHNTIVDLLRNDLSMVSDNVRVEKYRYISHIRSQQKNLLQVSSEISGELNADWKQNLGSIIAPLLPAGSVSGAPKKRSVEIIEKYESRPRGFYTGILGIFDGERFDSAVLIRYIQSTETPHVYNYFSGGGITALSDVDKEYKELINKIYVPTF